MTLEERSNLVLAFARVLYVNGQATDQTLARPTISATLSDCALRSCRAGESCNFRPRTGTPDSSPQWQPIPTGVDMDRVASTMRAIEELGAGSACARRRDGGDQQRSHRRHRRRPGCSRSQPQRAPWR